MNLAGQDAQVVRKPKVQSENVKSGSGQQFTAIMLIKDMVMQAPIRQIVQGTLVELIECASGGVHVEIVFLEDFGQMGQVVFTDVLVKIVEHMVNAGRLPAVIKGCPVIRKYQNQGAI
jgi:hypothetical protein